MKSSTTRTSPAQRVPRVRKLNPIGVARERAIPRPALQLLPPPTRSSDHVERDFLALRERIAVAVAGKQLREVERLMGDLLALIESTGPGRNAADESLRRKIVAHLDQCSQQHKALAELEKQARQHERFHANQLMHEVADLLHAHPVDEPRIAVLLDRAEAAYRRARDRRAQSIAGIRHKVAAEVRLARAVQQFDDGAIEQALATAGLAASEYSVFRTAPTYHSSQLLLSLSEVDISANQTCSLRDLSLVDEVLDQTFHDLDQFFQDRARLNAKARFEESKLVAAGGGESNFSAARAALSKAETYYQWLATPEPAAVIKWKRQLRREEMAHDVAVVERCCGRDGFRSVTAVLTKWTLGAKAQTLELRDLVETGALLATLRFAASLSRDDYEHSAEAATTVAVLLLAIWKPCSPSQDGLLHQCKDQQTALRGLIQLIEILEEPRERRAIFTLLHGSLTSKQAVHTAIHKCGLLESWVRIRDSILLQPQLVTAWLHVVAQALSVSFPLFLGAMVDCNVVRIVISTLARLYKDQAVADGCLAIIKSVCSTPSLTVKALSPIDTALRSALVSAFDLYTAAFSKPNIATATVLLEVITAVAPLDAAFANGIRAAQIPAKVASLGADRAWLLSDDVLRGFQLLALVPGKINRSEPLSPTKARSSPVVDSLIAATAPRIDGFLCVTKFGAAIGSSQRRQHCLIQFWEPKNGSDVESHGRLCVLSLKPRVEMRVYNLPLNGKFSIAVLRRELVNPVSLRGRCEFVRTLTTTLQPDHVTNITNRVKLKLIN